MPRIDIVSASDRAEGTLEGMHPETNGELLLLRDDLMNGRGNFNKGFDSFGNPDEFILGQPKRAVARNLYGGTEAGKTTKQNDTPIDIRETSTVFNTSFVDGESAPGFGDSALSQPPAPILKKVLATNAGYPASTTSSPYWIAYSWGLVGAGGVLHTSLSLPTLVPSLSQGQSIQVELPDEAIEGGVYLGLWLTEPGSSTPTQPGTFRLQKTIRFAEYPARVVELHGPYINSSAPGNSDSSTPTVNDTTLSPPPKPQARHENYGGLMRALTRGAHVVATYVTEKGETLPSEQYPPIPGWNHEVQQTVDGIDVNAGYGARTIYAGNHRLLQPRAIGWHIYFWIDGQYYRLYDRVTGNGRVRPLPPSWVYITTQFAEGHESWAVQNSAQKIDFAGGVDRLVSNLWGMEEWVYYLYMYPQDPPGVNSSGTPAATDPLPTPVVIGSSRPGAGHYVFQTTEIDEDGRETDPSETSEIDIGDYDVIRIVYGNHSNKIPNATFVERGADGLPLDFTFITTGGTVTLNTGELVFKTTSSTSGTTPSGITDPIDIDITKDWSAGALLSIENPPTGAFAGSFEAVLRELTSTGVATDTVLKNAAAVGEHAFYQVISETGGVAPAWRSDTTQAQILYRFSGATKNLIAKVSRQILKDYRYRFRRREEIPLEPSDPNPSPQTTAVPSGSTAVEPSPAPESVPETLTQTAPDRPPLSGTTLQSGDLESAMPTGFTQVTSGSATLTRETTPTITPLVGSYSLRSHKASGGSLSTAYLKKIYGVRSTTLTGAMTNSQTTVPLTDLAYWPIRGSVYIDSEKITYTGKSAVNGAGNLTGCIRGAHSSSAVTHSSGATATLLGRDALSLYAKRQIPTIPTNGYVTLGELRRWTDGARFAWIDLDTRNETAQLTITGGATASGNLTTTLDGTGLTTAVVATNEQSRLSFTSGVTQPGGTPYTGTTVLGLGGVNYNVPVYGGGETAQHEITVSGTAAGTGYFWLYLYDSTGVGLAIAVYLTAGDSASTMASKMSAAVTAAGYTASEWWTSSYTSGATFTLTANTNGIRNQPSRLAGSIMYPTFSTNNLRLGTNSPRLQTEKLQILGNFISTPSGFFSISLGMPRSSYRSLNFTSPQNGDSPVVVAKKIYDEFQAKYTQYEWNANYNPGSDTVYFVQKTPAEYLSAYATITSPLSLPHSFTTLYKGGKNDTADEVATRVRNSTFSGWTSEAGNTGAVVDFFAQEAGPKTDITFTGAGGVTATPSTVAQGSADTPSTVAGKIVTTYAGNPSWTVTNVSNVVTFVATGVGNKQDATFTPGATGVQAQMSTTVQGSTDIVASVYDGTLTRRRRVQTGLTTSSVVNTEIAVQGAGTSDGIVAVWGSSGASAISLLGWFEGLDLTDYPAGEVAAGATAEASSSLTWSVLTDSIEVTDRGKTYYETHDLSGNLINQVHGHYLPNQKESQRLLLQGYKRAILPGWQYTIAGKIRYDGVTSGTPFYASLFNTSGGEFPLRSVADGISGTGDWQALIDTGISGTGAWQEFTVTFTAPTDPACHELGIRSKNISSGEFLIQSLVVSPGTSPLRTPYYATSGTYVATMDISNPAMSSDMYWSRKRTNLFGEVPEPEQEAGYTTSVNYQSAAVLGGPYSGWVADPSLVPDNNIVQVRLIVAADGLSSFALPRRTPSVDYDLVLTTNALNTFLQGNRRELPGGAFFPKLKRPQQLKDVVVQRLRGESYARTAISARTGRQREFELMVFTPDAAEYIENNWNDALFSIEAFGKWYVIRLSAEPSFDPVAREREEDGQVYGVYIAKMPRAQILSMGDLNA